MRAAGIDTFGGEVQTLELAEPQSLAPDEVVIAVRAAGVGTWDEIVRVGGWDVGRRPPLVLGVDAAGVVAAVGDEVTSLAPGDEVLTHPLPLRDQGTWAERLVAPAALVARKPDAVPWETAAAFPVPALTADQALSEVVPAPGGESVLVHGAGGVTGGLVVQLAIMRGATVATAGPGSAARVRGYGATAVFDYHDPGWPARVREASHGGRGVGAAVNTARGADVDIGDRDSSLGSGRVAGDCRETPALRDGLDRSCRPAALAGGMLSLRLGATVPLAEAAAALQTASAGRASGATVLTLSHSPERNAASEPLGQRGDR